MVLRQSVGHRSSCRDNLVSHSRGTGGAERPASDPQHRGALADGFGQVVGHPHRALGQLQAISERAHHRKPACGDGTPAGRCDRHQPVDEQPSTRAAVDERRGRRRAPRHLLASSSHAADLHHDVHARGPTGDLGHQRRPVDALPAHARPAPGPSPCCAAANRWRATCCTSGTCLGLGNEFRPRSSRRTPQGRRPRPARTASGPNPWTPRAPAPRRAEPPAAAMRGADGLQSLGDDVHGSSQPCAACRPTSARARCEKWTGLQAVKTPESTIDSTPAWASSDGPRRRRRAPGRPTVVRTHLLAEPPRGRRRDRPRRTRRSGTGARAKPHGDLDRRRALA